MDMPLCISTPRNVGPWGVPHCCYHTKAETGRDARIS
jgi:hypothetical protein